MKSVAEFAAELDAETNAIKDRIDRLIAAGQLSAADAAALQAVSDRLAILGQDPANPIPARKK